MTVSYIPVVGRRIDVPLVINRNSCSMLLEQCKFESGYRVPSPLSLYAHNDAQLLDGRPHLAAEVRRVWYNHIPFDVKFTSPHRPISPAQKCQAYIRGSELTMSSNISEGLHHHELRCLLSKGPSLLRPTAVELRILNRLRISITAH